MLASEPTDIDDHALPIDRNEPTLPIDPNDATLPMESTEWREPNDSHDPSGDFIARRAESLTAASNSANRTG